VDAFIVTFVVADGSWEREEITKYLEAHPW